VEKHVEEKSVEVKRIHNNEQYETSAADCITIFSRLWHISCNLFVSNQWLHSRYTIVRVASISNYSFLNIQFIRQNFYYYLASLQILYRMQFFQASLIEMSNQSLFVCASSGQLINKTRHNQSRPFLTFYFISHVIEEYCFAKHRKIIILSDLYSLLGYQLQVYRLHRLFPCCTLAFKFLQKGEQN